MSTRVEERIGAQERDLKKEGHERSGSRVDPEGPGEDPRPLLTADERVLQASEGSFPASDPPGWIGGSATPCEDE